MTDPKILKIYIRKEVEWVPMGDGVEYRKDSRVTISFQNKDGVRKATWTAPHETKKECITRNNKEIEDFIKQEIEKEIVFF